MDKPKDTMNRLAFVLLFDHPVLHAEDIRRIAEVQNKILCGPLGTLPAEFSLGGQEFIFTVERWISLYSPDPLPQSWLRWADTLLNGGHIEGYHVWGQVEPLVDARAALMRAAEIEEAARAAFGHLDYLDRCGALAIEDMPILEKLRKTLGIKEK